MNLSSKKIPMNNQILPMAMNRPANTGVGNTDANTTAKHPGPSGTAFFEGKIDYLRKIAEEDIADAVLVTFLEYVSSLGLELYPAQEEAILEILAGRHVIINTPTGSGKSLVAMALHLLAMAKNLISYYTCPIKALVNEKFFDLCQTFGAANVGLMTGDGTVNRDAPIICCTAEVLANMGLRSTAPPCHYAVMDEFHYYGDRDRGAAWQIPLLTAKETQFLMMSATLGDCSHITEKIEDYSSRKVSVVRGSQRPVPLTFQYEEIPVHEAVDDLVNKGETPVYLVNFTQKASAEQAQNMTSINVCSKEDKQTINKVLNTARLDTPYGKELARLLRNGVGVHHAGLLPKYRLLVERLSQAGLLKVISGTDSLGVGVNIPIKTVLFTQLSKFDGRKTGILSAREFHQISGRAGRKGFDDQGRVVVLAPEHVIENRRIDAKVAAAPHLKKKLVRKSPPKGFVNWDKSVFERLLASLPEPMEPQLQINHSILMNVLLEDSEQHDRGYGRLIQIIRRSHIRPGEQRLQIKRAAELFRSLRQAAIVGLLPRDHGRGSSVWVDSNLQDDFSLNQALGLFMVEAVNRLDPNEPDYALNILSMVESIQENPNALLFKQIDKLKGDLVARLKAEGVPYEERMEQLEQVEYLKPMAEYIYDTFNEFAKSHPWVGNENIKPKSIARDMYERGLGFNEYVREYGLARSEGALLRYLSQVYKTASQSVPTFYWTEEFEDILSYLLTIVRLTDSSLLDEWEKMVDTGSSDEKSTTGLSTQGVSAGTGRTSDGGDQDDQPTATIRRQVRLNPGTDFKGFQRRIRSEMFLLLSTMATEDYEEAVEMMKNPVENGWNAETLKSAWVSFLEARSGLNRTPRARQPHLTTIREEQPGLWHAQQTILDNQDLSDWALVCRVDVREPVDPDRPLIELVSIS